MPLTRTERIQAIMSRRQEGIVVLEDIHDPHNAGAVLRSCDAFGFQTVYFVFNTVKPYNPRRVGKGSSASANKWLTIEVLPTIEECYHKLKEEGYHIYATTLKTEHPVNLYGPLPTLGPRIALVFGNEHAGLSEYALTHADSHLHIPMRGFVESLNISVSAALVLAEITRKREKQGSRFMVHGTGK